jgi:hypothetical protein
MRQSDSQKELYMALAKAQAQFKVAEKDTTNPYFKSKYADFESIVSSCRQALSNNGLSFVQITSIEQNGNLILITRLCHASGEYIESSYPIEPIKKDPQALGSALTYAKRYSLSALLGVVTSEEDDDGEAAMCRKNFTEKQHTAPVLAPKKYSEHETKIFNMKNFMQTLGVTEDMIKNKFKLKNIFELNNEQIEEIKHYAELIKKGEPRAVYF